jgi:hypothetical protein
MSTKNEPPIEVTLEQSPSGTWTVPDHTKRQFKPWQRLWFVTGVIYLLLLAVSYNMLMPNEEKIERKMVLSVTEEVKRFEGMAFAGESPRNIFEIARTQGYADWIKEVRHKYRIGPEGNTGFDRIEKNYRESISDLPVKRTFGMLICIVIWIVPMAVFYAMGFVIDWIKRGIGVIPK